MYLVFSSKWDASRAVGQERLVVDIWLELASNDGTPIYWGYVYSAFQLLTNLKSVILDVERDVLKEYHIKDLIDEILDRLDNETWLGHHYAPDIFFLKEQLRDVRDHLDDSATRKRVLSILSAFLEKVGTDDTTRKQLDYLCGLAADSSTKFQVVVRAVAELTNDLLYAGYSRDRLHGWMLRNVVGAATTCNYLELLRNAVQLTTAAAVPYRVLLHAHCPPLLTGRNDIQTHRSRPVDFQIDAAHPLSAVSRGCFAEVRVESARDPWAAVEIARRAVRRFFNSNRLAWRDFDRSVSNYAAVLDLAGMKTIGVDQIRALRGHRLHNERAFYSLTSGAYHKETFSQLDRIIYWLEQSWQTEDLGALVSQWTTLEFLCSIPGKSAPEAIRTLLPVYVVPRYPRLLLLDFWKFCLLARIAFPQELRQQLKIHGRDPHGMESKCDLVELLKACIEPDATNTIRPLIEAFPILLYKLRRLQRLDPVHPHGSARHAAIWEDLSCFERQINFDLQTSYRVRNTIVHDAATVVAQLDRIGQRLNWLLCTTLDVLLFQFSRNPTLTLSELHDVNLAWFKTWKSDLKDHTVPKDLAGIVQPRVPCLR